MKYFFLACLVCTQCVLAQSIRTVQGLSGAELKTALYHAIQPDLVLKYGGKGEGYTWAGFTKTDVMPNGSVRDRYSNKHYLFNGYNAVAGMNIEHSFANSWWGHTVNNAYCDLHHLYPSDAYANQRKSNNPIGVVDGTASFDNGVTKVGRSSSYRADSLITAWEPADRWKGDFARTYFYMATCYENLADVWQTKEGLIMLQNNTYPTLRPWVTTLLREWNANDPVDDIEVERNSMVQDIQGNRNPFIDYPELCEYIWGSKVGTRFYISDTEEPEVFVPEVGKPIDLGMLSKLRPCTGDIVLRGRGATASLSISIEGEGFSIAPSSVTPEQLIEGTTLCVTYDGTKCGNHEAKIKVVGGGINETYTTTMEIVDGMVACPATDILSSMYIKRFTANWKKWDDECTYTLLVTKTDGTPLEGYPVKGIAETSYKVDKGLAANQTYFYTITTSTGIESNRVEVYIPEVTASLSAKSTEMNFTAIPGQPSGAQTLEYTAIALKSDITAETTAPFAISSDGENWSQSLTLPHESSSIFVRIEALAEEQTIEGGELILSAEGVEEIAIVLNAEVNTQKAFMETFEVGTKSSYAVGDVTCAATTWTMDNMLIGKDANDHKEDAAALRIRYQTSAPNTLDMTTDAPYGCDSLWFYAGPYGTDAAANLTVSYSIDGGQTWTPVVSDLVLAKGSWKRYGYEMKQEKPIRLRFTVTKGTNGKRVNVDNIQMSAFKSPTGMETLQAIPHTTSKTIYNLSGQRVSSSYRGLIIREGKKVVK